MVMRDLLVEAPARGSVIPILFQHPDPEVTRDVLTNVIVAYYRKHVDAHQPVGVFGGVLTQEIQRLSNQLAHTEQQLREAKKTHFASASHSGVAGYSVCLQSPSKR